ncbi:MAG: sugar phosphate isomerase/epimerase [Spirochaetaceae bacterium]|nr:sugar phosphate isomerase/epimerase [Spirochaetaceae bacterium]
MILGNLGNTNDRFLSTGYKDQPSKQEMVERAAKIEGISGIELVGTWDITSENTDEMATLLGQNNLKCVSIIPDLFSQKRWGKGSLAAKDPTIRSQAIDAIREAAEMARKIGCPMLNIWPGQDGYDYSLQADFRAERRWFTQGIRTVAEEYPDIRFALEYKPKEPRTHSYLARAADTLLVAEDTGAENVGVCIDVGHALNAYENVAESIVILQERGKKLFHMHFNDNYRSWDDDMIVGSVHFVEYIEMLYWLRETGYDGWYSMDQYPYREDGAGAIDASVQFLRSLETLMDDSAMEEIRGLIHRGDPIEASHWLRKKILP